jgi:hypothetical protein
LTPEQEKLRHKFRGLHGGQLVVDAFGRKRAVTIRDEQGRVFYTSSVLSPRNRSRHSYDAAFGVPITLRAIWRREGEVVGGVVQNPIRITDQYGIYEGGTVVGDYTVPVASRIPDDLLEELRRNKHVGFRLKLRLHDDGLLVGWDLASPVDSRPCKIATTPMNTGRAVQLGIVRTLGLGCNDAQFLGVLRI